VYGSFTGSVSRIRNTCPTISRYLKSRVGLYRRTDSRRARAPAKCLAGMAAVSFPIGRSCYPNSLEQIV
jgi:hypothetical protein